VAHHLIVNFLITLCLQHSFMLLFTMSALMDFLQVTEGVHKSSRPIRSYVVSEASISPRLGGHTVANQPPPLLSSSDVMCC